MTKRKVTSGGYEDSSDGSEPEFVKVPATKRMKPVPAPSVHPKSTPKPGKGDFQLPQSKSRGSGAWVVVKSKQQVKHDHTHHIDDHQEKDLEIHSVDNSSDSEPEVVVSQSTTIDMTMTMGTGTGKPKLGASSRPPVPPKSVPARSTLSLERQVNELTNTFEKYKETLDMQMLSADQKLTRLLEVVSRLIPDDVGLSVQVTPASRDGSVIPLVIPESKACLSNPAPTPELIGIVSKVVSEARLRVGKKKGGSDDNSLKEHARKTFYRMLNISASKVIQPYFEDQYGEPDTLPEQFLDPETNYCQPYPHWKATLARQVRWIPTFILRFRFTIPNDQSELSIRLRELTDEQIVVLLCDGPFRTAQTNWRNLKRTDEELEVMRSNARRYRRVERKASVRSGYIKTIPSLQGQEWDYLTHPGYMSQDESDSEGVLTTKQPDYRAQWTTNFFDAMRVAEFKRAKGRPPASLGALQRKVEIAKCPIPQLERGSGSGKFIVQVAACGLSKGWQKQYPDEVKKYAHLVNPKVLEKPDIGSFLSEHPMPIDRHPSQDTDLENDNDLVHRDEDGFEIVGDYDGAFGRHAVSDDVAQDRVSEMGDGNEVEEGPESSKSTSNTEQDENAPKPLPNAGERSVPPSNLGASQQDEMPPPPLLVPEADAVPNSEDDLSKAPPKRTRRTTKAAKATTKATAQNPDPGAPAPKKRGRPPGSKNKAK